MNILQLRDKLNDLLAAGVDSTLPVVIPTLEFDDRTLHIGELLKLEVRDNETYEYDSVKLAVQRKSGSVLALNFTNNDGWQNDSFGVTRVIELPASKIAFNDLYRLADPSIETINVAKALGHKYVYFKTPFGHFHEIINIGQVAVGLKGLDPERVIRKPFDSDEFLSKWKPEPYQSDAMSWKKIQLHCQAIGMEDPSVSEHGKIPWALYLPENKEV